MGRFHDRQVRRTIEQRQHLRPTANCMDLAVVASLILQENMADKADLRLTLLEDAKKLPIEAYQTPKPVDSKASMIKKGTII